MLHDNLITENFLHHVQKDQNISPSQTNSPTKINLYDSFHYKQMQNHLIYHRNQQQQQNEHHHHHQPQQQEDEKVLDLSRRHNSIIKPQPRKILSSLTNERQFSLSSSPEINEENRKSISPPIQRPEISASLLAENLQKFYNQQNLLEKSALINSTLIQNQSHSLSSPLYPIYYPQIKQELIENSTNLTNIQQQKDLNSLSLTSSTNILQIPQPICNLFQSNENLLKTTSTTAPYPISQQKLENSTITSNISPKSTLKSDLTDDRISDTSSIPGSPSSSTTSITYPKLINQTINTNTSAYTNSNESNSTIINKPTRPFKAFPRDPLVIAANFAATDVLYDNPRVERYTEYRKRVLEQIRSANGGERTISNPKIRRLNTRNNFNNSNTNLSSDGSYSDSQANNSEVEEEEHANDSSSDNDTIVQSTTNNFDNNSDNSNNSNKNIIKKRNNNNNDESKNNGKDINGNQNSNGIIKDAAYYERRRKNNAAAKKSRDRRRIKEDEIAIRAAYLERQNIELLCQLDALKAQLAALTKVQTSS